MYTSNTSNITTNRGNFSVTVVDIKTTGAGKWVYPEYFGQIGCENIVYISYIKNWPFPKKNWKEFRIRLQDLFIFHKKALENAIYRPTIHETPYQTIKFLHLINMMIGLASIN